MDNEWYVKQAHEAIDKLSARIVTLEHEKAQVTFDFAGAKIEQPQKYVMPTVYLDTKNPDEAQRKADEYYAADKVRRETNAPLLAGNKKIRDALITLMKNLGFSEVQYSYTGRSHKRVETTSEWAAHLYRIPTGEGTDIDRIYAEWCRDIKKRRDEIEKENADKKRKADAEERQRTAMRLLVSLGIKYGQDFKTVDDAIDYILQQDKYLRLAYYLELNRGDWSDGCDYAETGLNGFSIETEQDQQIHDEISSLCSDWDGDGRVFRDCTWNYGAIYGLSSEDLHKDLSALMEYEQRY